MPETPFAPWMRRRRSERGLTQADMASAAEKALGPNSKGEPQHLSVSFMSNLENGRRDPRPELAEAIAVALQHPRDLGLFMAGYVPSKWLEAQGDDEVERLKYLEEFFSDCSRMAMGAHTIVRGDGRTADGGSSPGG